eukprot:Nitzschia sp. Nitz4//scaffold135_size62275//2907//5329//NITZ4_006343-RA/size62275-augustus-gene-0.7-mRNA-1//-1//CDS//3329535542//4139//frame0
MSFPSVARCVSKAKGLAALSVATSTVAAVAFSRSEQERETDNGPEERRDPLRWLASGLHLGHAITTTSCSAQQEPPSGVKPAPHHNFSLRRRATLAKMGRATTQATLESKYDVNPDPIGEGSFGQVFVARDRETGELVAVKKIWKEFSDNHDFVREMGALLRIRQQGGHPHICQLRENFEEDGSFSLVFDLIKGGEMFDHLVERGAYSELDASRLIREVASALAFLHGIGIVHCDLKPENLMLSSKSGTDASIKLVDFGSSEQLPRIRTGGTPITNFLRRSGGTIAYSPPEAFDEKPAAIADTIDMWSLGVILHIMLTGVHPFDLQGDAEDEDLAERLRYQRRPELHTEETAHLSDSAIELLSKLLEPDPALRLKAHEMLDHPWVRGLTARRVVMADSDQKLSKVRKFRTQFETKAFQTLMKLADRKHRDQDNGESLVEVAFKSLDKNEKGFLTLDDITQEDAEDDTAGMSLSAFHELLGENMQNKYFPTDHIIFQEGDIGKYMYFLNSGTCEVTTKGGFHHLLEHGDTFGEGCLIHQEGRRSATIRTLTPVHVIQIDRECFQKYLMGSENELALSIKEKVNKRKFGRAEFIIGKQEDLEMIYLEQDDKVYTYGDIADTIYYVVDGSIAIRSDGHTVYHAEQGQLHGVQSFFFKRARDADAVCVSDTCVVKAMTCGQCEELSKEIPEIKKSLYELALRREFQRAIVRKLNTSFASMSLRDVFDSIDTDKSGKINTDEIRSLLAHLKVSISESELKEMLETLDLDKTGVINFDEFTTLFTS